MGKLLWQPRSYEKGVESTPFTLFSRNSQPADHIGVIIRAS
jgi:hypothetical protein